MNAARKSSADETPLREVKKGQRWFRKDPTRPGEPERGDEFDVTSITNGPGGWLVVHGRTANGRQIKAGYAAMRKDHERFRLVKEAREDDG